MKLVEVIRGYSTSDEVTDTIMKLAANLGKVPTEVNDFPGFVANRILMPMINEAIETLFHRVGGVKEIRYCYEIRYGPSHGAPSISRFYRPGCLFVYPGGYVRRI